MRSTRPPRPPQATADVGGRVRPLPAVWMSAAALFTDPLGRVLLVKPTCREQVAAARRR